MKAFKTFIAKIFAKPHKKIKEFFRPKKPFLNKNKFQIILCVLICIGIFFIVFYFFQPKSLSLGEEITDKDRPFNMRNIAIALAAIATAVFTWWKNSLNHKATEINQKANEINQKEAEIEESTRQDGLFAKAVEFIGEKNDLTTRKGGVHILKDLAMTSPKHAQKCIDMLCSLNEAWMPKFLQDYPDFFRINFDFANIKNLAKLKIEIGSKDISIYNSADAKSYIGRIALSQLVLLSMAEIIRHINDNYEYQGPFDLQYKYLCSIDLYNIILNKNKFKLSFIDLQNAILLRADLQEADLRFSDLQNAFLREANLQNAILHWANLQNAILQEADLRNADLSSAYLQKANLENANLENTNLQNAILMEANLQNADLHSANLQNVNLEAADFTGAKLLKADFRNAINIDKAIFGNSKKNAIFTDEDYKRYHPNP